MSTHTPGHPPSHPTRRAVVAGAAWAVPLVAVGAPAAMAGVSKCLVTGSIQVGPNVPTTIRAIWADSTGRRNTGLFERA
ncbi:MAG: hypothetical protein IPF90_03625 [Actinomycetales bacterium]|nr:hypothetical protein [Candidatus Phosphoribacter baldrii]